MDPVTGSGDIAKALEMALKVPGLLPALVIALVSMASFGVAFGFWARGLVRWGDFNKAMAALTDALNRRVENTENTVDANSHKALLEVRETAQRCEVHLSRFDEMMDKFREIISDVKTQVAALAAIIGVHKGG